MRGVTRNPLGKWSSSTRSPARASTRSTTIRQSDTCCSGFRRQFPNGRLAAAGLGARDTPWKGRSTGNCESMAAEPTGHLNARRAARAVCRPAGACVARYGSLSAGSANNLSVSARLLDRNLRNLRRKQENMRCEPGRFSAPISRTAHKTSRESVPPLRTNAGRHPTTHHHRRARRARARARRAAAQRASRPRA